MGGAGSAVSVFGGLWSIAVEKRKKEGETLLMKRLQELILDDLVMTRKLERAIEYSSWSDFRFLVQNKILH